MTRNDISCCWCWGWHWIILTEFYQFWSSCCWVSFFSLSHFPLEIAYLRMTFSLKVFPEQGKDNWSVIPACFTRGDQNFISLLWPILRQTSRLFLRLNPKLVQGLMQLNWQHCIRLQFSNWCQREACQSPLAPAELVEKMLQLIIMALKKAVWLGC